MKKSILNLVGAQELSKNEQKSVNGGFGFAELCSENGPNGEVVICYPPFRCAFDGSYSYCTRSRF
jgi:hypothetical protein